SMAIPYADLDHILTYGRYYGARYLVVDWYTAVRLRPQLEILRTVDEVPGLRLVHQLRSEGRTTRIFGLDPAPPPGRPGGVVGRAYPAARTRTAAHPAATATPAAAAATAIPTAGGHGLQASIPRQTPSAPGPDHDPATTSTRTQP